MKEREKRVHVDAYAHLAPQRSKQVKESTGPVNVEALLEYVRSVPSRKRKSHRG